MRVGKQTGLTPSGLRLSRRADRSRMGFTLIEIMIVLAISSLLSIILLGLFSNQQRRSRFTDAVQSLAAELEKVKTEANSGYTTGSGSTAGRVFFGKSVAFTPGSAAYTIRVLTADRQADTIQNLQQQTQAVKQMPWGVSLSSSDYPVIVFGRNLTTSLLRTYILASETQLLDEAAYQSASSDNINQASLIVTSPEGLQATIVINEENGEVSVDYAD